MKADGSKRKSDTLERNASACCVRDLGAPERGELTPRPPPRGAALGDDSLACKYNDAAPCPSGESFPEGLSGQALPRTGRQSANCRVDSCRNQLVIQSLQPVILRLAYCGAKTQRGELAGKDSGYAGTLQSENPARVTLMCGSA